MRKIALVTSTRAEYGILSRLIGKLEEDPAIELQLIVTGTHLSEKFGNTIKEITYPVTKKIDIEIEKTPAHSLALCIEKFDQALRKLRPDLLVILGDRYEIMGVAQAAMLNNIPIAHLYGGDTTEGAIDEAIRHSITKMSHLHFTSCEESRKRVIQLGENPERVFNFGALAIENIKNAPLLSKEELEKAMDFKFAQKNILVTFHPVTLEGNAKIQFNELLEALKELKDTNIIITCPNSDEGNEEIFELITEFEKAHRNVKAYKSLGMKRYLSCLKYVDMAVGNSSSGIYEVPAFHKPTVNIGNRQRGRLQCESIINCKPEKGDILNAISIAYKKDCSNIDSPYYKENTANNIVNIIKNYNLQNILHKVFYNIDIPENLKHGEK